MEPTLGAGPDRALRSPMALAVSGTNNPLATKPASDVATSDKKSTGLDRDAFLKLLVAQMSHQDPLAPTQGTEYVAQLSQLARVEQSGAQSTKLDTLSAQMGGLSNNAATDLVGKTVNVRGHGIAWDG